MAMPSMSRPRSGHDMDILKSILGTSSEHSSTSEKSPTKTRSRTNSTSSLTSASSAGTKNESCTKSQPESDASCSDSESRTESQRDRSSSIDEKSHPLKGRKSSTEKGEKNEKGTKNDRSSEMESEKSSEVKNTKQIKKQRKLHLKKQRNSKVQKNDSDNKECDNVKNNDNKHDESKQDEERKQNNSHNDGHSHVGEDHIRRHHKGTETKKQRDHQHLSKRAQRTLNLYPQRYADPDRLRHNYEELQEILQSRFIKDEHSVNEELVRETKRVLSLYEQRLSGFAGTLRPPPGAPAAGRRIRRVRSATRERSPAWTQTDLTEEQGTSQSSSAKGYYFIDTTKPDHSKRVTFVQAEDGELMEDNVDIDNDKQSHSTYTVSIQLNPKPTCQSSSEPERGRLIKKITRRPKSASSVTDKRKQGSRSLSPQTSPSSKATLRTTSESSTSRSRSSQSRSPSTDRRHTDNHLESTENAKIKEWLRRKNRLLRQQRREERRLRREKRKQEAEETKLKMEKHEKAEALFRQWVEQKEREARLLKRRKRKQRQQLNCSGTTVSSETETVDLKSGKTVNAVIPQNEQGTGVHRDGEKTTSTKHGVTLHGSTNGHDGRDCTCGYGNNVQSSGMKTKLSQQMKKGRRLTPKLKKSDAEPATTKNKTSDDENSEEKKRLSYDEWLKQKRSADMERRKQEKRQQEELLMESDPEMDSIVSGMAKRRIQNILKGKKQIRTGITGVDNNANQTMDERVLRKQKMNGRAEEVAPPSGSSARFYRWVPKADEKGDHSSRKRPVSAHVRSSSKVSVAKGERPVSAKVSSISLKLPKEKSDGENQRSVSPKPKIPPTKAYKNVKYQQQSWNEFSDYVWEKLNEEAETEHENKSEKREDAQSRERDERKTSEKINNQSTSEVPESKSEERGETRSPEQDQGKSTEKTRSQSMFEIPGETKESNMGKEGDEKEQNYVPDESKEELNLKDDQVKKEDRMEPSQQNGEEKINTNMEDQLSEADHGTDDRQENISLASSTDTDKDPDEDANDDKKQSVENECISKVVEETIFSMTEVDAKFRNEQAEADFSSNLRRPSVALENIQEEIEEEVEQAKQEDDWSSSSGKQSSNDGDSDSVEQPEEETGENSVTKSNQEVDAVEQPKEEANDGSTTQSNQGQGQQEVDAVEQPKEETNEGATTQSNQCQGQQEVDAVEQPKDAVECEQEQGAHSNQKTVQQEVEVAKQSMVDTKLNNSQETAGGEPVDNSINGMDDTN